MLYWQRRRARINDGGNPSSPPSSTQFGNSAQVVIGACRGARDTHICRLRLPFLPCVGCCPRVSVLVCIFNVRALGWASVCVYVERSKDFLPSILVRLINITSCWWWAVVLGCWHKLDEAPRVGLIIIKDDLTCVLYMIMC